MTDQQMELKLTEDYREIQCIAFRVRQPIGDFYSSVLPSKKLVDICFFDIRGLTRREDFADFMGIQRELDAGRVAEIKRYVQTLDPSFPTAIVLAIDERCVKIEEQSLDSNIEKSLGDALVKLTISNLPNPSEDASGILYKDIARIIDGQHRIAGLVDYSGPQFDLPVSIFIGADIATQASIFSTVNQSQTKVNRSLVIDLFAYARTRSPEKTCHEIAVVLDREPKSPFFERIKRLGTATEGRFGETLSQAAFVKGLIGYISRDLLADRDAGRRNRSFPRYESKIRQEMIFRDFFVADQDELIANNIWNYFDAVRERWPVAWSKTGRGWVLNKTAGYSGLMRFLKPCYRSLSHRGNVPSKDSYLSILKSMDLDDSDFMSSEIRPGTSGEKYVYERLVSESML